MFPTRPAGTGVESSGAQRYGIALLEETLDSFGRFIEHASPVHVALGEFLEIVTLDRSLEVETAFRIRIQSHQAAYFLVGSRRRVPLGIFTDSQRPLFQTAINHPHPLLPADELADFVRYYTDKFSFLVYELSGIIPAESIVDASERLRRTIGRPSAPAFAEWLNGQRERRVA